MTVAVRFAPSPTGILHVGSARTALIVWLFARKHKGTFLLRIDDTDLARSTEENVEDIKSGLTWLGLDWDAFARQRDRNAIYDRNIQKLKDIGRLYPCYETEEELALMRKTLLQQKRPPIYDRAALHLTDTQKAAFEAQGRKPHWRFKLEHKPIVWDDLVRGRVEFHGETMSDPVLVREDGRPLYHICSVIDDIDFKITHIVRGEDHVSNSASHIQMFEALGAKPPQLAHVTLLGDMAGGKLSKRKGSLGIKSLAEEVGIEKMALISLIARIGTSDPIEPLMTMDEVIGSFDFSKYSRNLPKFDEEELYRLNAKILHRTEFKDVKERLEKMGLVGIDEDFWNIVRPNLELLPDVKDWWHVAKGPVEPVIEDADFAKAAAALLPADPWDNTTWDKWVNAVKTETGRKGKNLFMPLRQAITGQDHGPELKELLPLIGRQRVLERLKAA
ncbi:MAG: glutamate--tRNA ligase [Alphaproteobacteria bacterium]|nr:glutamate--tRNA ligase [Alphaproteobacteria bacterium]MDE2337319.1 glutamate--tRNA ligase [Alphaproteobacteria bacterium]